MTSSDEQIKAAYQTLGLRPGQGEDKVKQAYRTLARALHPDRNPEARTTMAAINQAYTTLLQYFKTPKPEPQSTWSLPFTRWSKNLLAWLGGKNSIPAQKAQQPAIKTSSSGQDEPDPSHWLLRDITREDKKLIYKVEVFGNPKGLALPLRRRRPCRVCQGSGKIWEQGFSNTCGNCGGRGYIIKPVSLSVALPDRWQPGDRIVLDTPSLSKPLEVELHRPDEELALMIQDSNMVEKA